MKVFISGPMRNKPDSNKEAFFDAEYKLKRLGYSVFNPAWCQYGVVTEFTADDMHAVDFAALERCDAIYMLKGWQYSKGARAEYFYAKAHGLKIFGDYTNYKPDAIKSIAEELALDKFKNDLPDICCSNKIDSVEKKYKDLAEDVEDCKKEIDILFNNLFDGLEKRVDLFNKIREEQYDSVYGLTTAKFDDVNQAINDVDRKMNNRYADNLNKINGLKKEVEAIKESIGTDDLQGQLDKDFKDVYNEFQSVKDMVNDINFGYIDWSSEVSQFDERIEKLEDNMKDLAANGGLGLGFNLMNKRIDVLEASIHKLEESFSEVADDNLSLNAIISKNNEDIEETRKHVMSFYDGEFIDTFNKVDDRLKKLEKTVNGLNSIVGELGNSIDNIFENQRELNSDYAALHNNYIARNEQLETLEKTVNGLNNRLEKIENFVADCRLSEPKSKDKKA